MIPKDTRYHPLGQWRDAPCQPRPDVLSAGRRGGRAPAPCRRAIASPVRRPGRSELSSCPQRPPESSGHRRRRASVSAARSLVPVRLVGAAASDGRSGSASSRRPVATSALGSEQGENTIRSIRRTSGQEHYASGLTAAGPPRYMDRAQKGPDHALDHLDEWRELISCNWPIRAAAAARVARSDDGDAVP